MKKTDIVPALLVHSVEALESQLASLANKAPLVQVDLVGKNYLQYEEEMPLWQQFDFEFDLMTADARHDAEVAVTTLGASRIVVHADLPCAQEALDFLQPYRQGDFKVEVGVGLPYDASVTMLEQFDGQYDYVQVMGIAKIGVQGQPFDVRALETVEVLHEAYPELLIQVDGGVKPENVQSIFDAGAKRVAVGSAYRDVTRQM